MGNHIKDIELKAIGTAITSTAAATAVAFNPVMVESYKAVFRVAAIVQNDEDETYVLSVEASDDGFSSNVVELGALPDLGFLGLAITAPDTFEIPLSGEAAEALNPNLATIRVKATLGGTTPSITYEAFLSPR